MVIKTTFSILLFAPQYTPEVIPRGFDDVIVLRFCSYLNVGTLR